MIEIIAAVADNGVIGLRGALPWRIPGELAYFRRVTMGRSVVMGRKTHASIGRPLDGRTNYVLTGDPGYRAEGCRTVGSVGEVLALTGRDGVFVIGGGAVYRLFLPLAGRLWITRVHATPQGDTWFPEIDGGWRVVRSTEGPADVVAHTFQVLEPGGG